MNKNGYTLLELLMSFIILAIIMLSASEFTVSIFKSAFSHSIQLKNANNARFSAERVFDQIGIADYIYPANINLSLNIGGSVTSINTNNAVAYLLSDQTDSTPPNYYLKVFYLQKNSDGYYDLYEFSSNTAFNWDINTAPSTNITSATGTSSKIAENIISEESSLSYTLNNDNGVTDSILLGSISNTATNNANALIKGISWSLKLQLQNRTKNLIIEELSDNVPRFIDQ